MRPTRDHTAQTLPESLGGMRIHQAALVARRHRAHVDACVTRDRRCVAYNHDGTQIAAGLASGKVLVLDPKRLEEICARHTREQPITDLKFSPDGQSKSMYVSVRLSAFLLSVCLSSVCLPFFCLSAFLLSE